MRVKCRSCGRKYDYEGCGGMCPKCAAYYQMDYKPEEDMLGERFESRNEYEEKSKSDKGKKSVIYTWCMVILMIIVMLFPFLTAQLADTASDRRDREWDSGTGMEQSTEQDIMQVTSLGVGEAFPYEAVNNYNYEGKKEQISYSIRVTGAKADEELTKQMPEGYEMLAVSYEITKEGAEEEQSEDISQMYSIYTDTYLLTKSGKYLYPVENYQMENLLGCEQEELQKRGIDSEFSYSKGLFYFMVKQGDAAGLRIFCQRFDYDNYQITDITAGYEIVGLGGENDE